LAIELAKHQNTSIISADSRQCYRELNIGVAKPSESQLSEIQHYFISSHSVTDDVNVKSFESYSLDAIEKIFAKNDTAIIVGGTGLYINALLYGIDEIPAIDEQVRNEINHAYQQHGMMWLQNQVQVEDPEFYRSGEILNPARLIRALEVIRSTGKSILQFHSGSKQLRNFSHVKIGLRLPKDQLHAQIDQRVDFMMEEGLVAEVKGLKRFRNLKALNTVGYKEIFHHLDSTLTLEQAINDIKKHTRQYAKRQMTWFKRDDEITWFDPNEGLNPILKHISSYRQ
jgi:tRNA dimethylallyltransferase